MRVGVEQWVVKCAGLDVCVGLCRSEVLSPEMAGEEVVEVEVIQVSGTLVMLVHPGPCFSFWSEHSNMCSWVLSIDCMSMCVCMVWYFSVSVFGLTSGTQLLVLNTLHFLFSLKFA